jgi:O-antigen/teichoic acid export membrane protein
MDQIKARIFGAYHILHELKKYQKLCAQFFTYAFGMVLIRSISLLCAPITMLILTTEDYGLLALANSFTSLFSSILGLGLRQALPLYYFQYTQPSRNRLIRRISFTYLSYAAPVLLIAFLNLSRCNNYFFLNHAPTHIIIICLLIAFCYFFVELIYQLLQYQQDTWTLTKLQTSIALITVACNMIFLYIFRWGPISILLGQAVGMLCVLLTHRTIFAHIFTQSIANDYTCISMRRYILQGLPFVPSMLCGLLLASGDRWALAHLSTLHNVGIYSLANTLAQFTNMIILYALTGSYMPYLLKRFNEHMQPIALIEKENKRIMWLCMCASFIVLCIGFSIIKPLALWCIPQKFHEAINYMGILLIGSIFYLGTHFLNCLIQFHKKTLFLGFVLFIPALLNIGLNLLLIPLCGIYGCVIATLMAYVVYFLITFGYNKRLCDQAM